MTAADLQERASTFFRDVQSRLIAQLEAADGRAKFRADPWQRPDGGGGLTCVLEGGALLEKAGVNWSDVSGELPAELADKTPGEGRAFRATGLSLVLHPQSPYIPTVHANFRCLVKGDACWFGGGADLTPVYPQRDDVVHFHRTWRDACDRHDPSYYPRFKKWCDEYFHLPHRQEMRGVGGIFFDYLAGDEAVFAFVRDAAASFAAAYLPIVERRRDAAWSERERNFQLWRRGRYVEFNLLYDRGTVFGLKTGGRIESILMSLPAEARWIYDHHPEPGSPEAALAAYLQPQDWLEAQP